MSSIPRLDVPSMPVTPPCHASMAIAREPRLTLHEVVAAEAARLRLRDTAVANFLADKVDEIAAQIWLVNARSLAEFEGRRAAADRLVDERFERLRGQDADQDPRWSDEPIGW